MRQPTDGWQKRVRDSFARQQMMATLGVSMETLQPGRITLAMPHHASFTQQHGFLHAGATTALADSACGYAAFSLAGESQTVLTVEFKQNLLAPARGERFLATAEVVRAGRTLVVCQARVQAEDGEGATTDVAAMLATIMLFDGTDQQQPDR